MLSFILGLLIGVFIFMLIHEYKARLITLWQHPRYWRGILACPHAEPLHYHHDGCPACFTWIPSDEEMDAMAQHYEEEGH